jgi:hypothetical protein
LSNCGFVTLANGHEFGIGGLVALIMQVFVKWQGFLAAPFFQPIESDASDDTQEPDSTVTTSEAFEIPRSATIRFLNSVLGSVLVPSQPASQVVGGIQMRQRGQFKLPPLVSFQFWGPLWASLSFFPISIVT